MKSKSKSKSKSTESKSPDFASSDFSIAITRTAVAQICQTTGFKAAQTSALETLTAITARYLETLGYAAASSATSTGRTESNLLDIIIALEDLHSVQGFIGSSNVKRSLFSSSVLNDVVRFVNYNVEIPFAKPIPRSDTGCPISVPDTIVHVVEHDIHCGSYSNEEGFKSPCGNCHFANKSVNAVSVNSVRDTVVPVKHDIRCCRSYYSQQSYESPRGTCHLANKSVNLAHIPRWLPEIPEMGSGEEGSREEKWGFGEGGEGCLVGEKMGGEEKEKERVGNMELPLKRGKVRFKMGVGMGGERFGVDLRSGVCRGGKRVSCQIWSVNEDGKNVRSKR